ncbi:MAG: LytTR family DNA-binding domain-containing protein [Hyphomonadaceae bacterium]|nr:LytTR family DNA-binding domain-containing protein [Hyphomonadaceae bacterium]
MTTGGTTGTNGGQAGTSGWRLDWVPLAVIAAIGVVVAVINATSVILEAQTGGAPIDPAAAWLYEISSVAMVVALSPAIGWMVWKVPPTDEMSAPPWLRFLGLHFAAACVFSLLHIVGMVAIRKLGYAAAGSDYVFAYRGDVVLPFVYEWRKDVLTYASNGVAYWTWGVWLAHQAAQALLVAPPVSATSDARIEIRNGARVTLVEPAQIAWIEAAGNYVEIHAGGVTHLARGTLAAFAEKLAGRGFVRIHRSRLVNRARVKAFKPTQSGDLEITLDDDYVIMGSRRFRAAMESV